VVILWTHRRGQASDREEKRNSPGTGENLGPGITKNSTNEASMLLKTRDGILKRTQNELRIDSTMRASIAEFELFGATRVPARVWDAGMRPGWRLPGWRRSGDARHNAKTSWNEAKKYLKTKDITFSSGAN
jgi:hypothetical protein